jgi:carbamoyl-phosphate synthase small subunit
MGRESIKLSLVDCGVKSNIIKKLSRDTTVIRVPWDHDFNNMEYDGLYLKRARRSLKFLLLLIENIALHLKGTNLFSGYAWAISYGPCCRRKNIQTSVRSQEP